MSEAREKARALLAATAGVRLTAQRGGGPLTHGIAVDVHGASLFMEADERIPIGSLQAIAAAPGLLAALCDENDASGRRLHLTKKVVEVREESNHAWAAENDALLAERDALRAELAKVTAAHAFQSSEVNGLLGEVDCMEHEDSQLRAEVERLRTELAMERATQSRELLTECARTLGAVGLVAVPGEVQRLVSERDVLQAGLAQEAALRAELTAEVKRLKAGNAVLGARVAIVCECVKSRQGPMGGSIARPLPGCDECGGTGGIIVDGDA